jgi:hypothetical protein
LPWAKVNNTRSADNRIISNTFKGPATAIQLRRTIDTDYHGPEINDAVDVDDASRLRPVTAGTRLYDDITLPEPIGETAPVGGRTQRRGRENIIMTEWGPYDWREPMIIRSATTYHEENNTTTVRYRLLGDVDLVRGLRVSTSANMSNAGEASGLQALLENDDHTMTVTFNRPDVYRIAFGWTTVGGDVEQFFIDHLTILDWSIQWFVSPCDPREDVETWRAAAKDAEIVHKPVLHELYKSGGPNETIGSDHFGTMATTILDVPPGRWRLRTMSDDGIRVWMNEKLIIDDWTWHGPTQHDYDFELAQSTPILLRVEHFELDGFAVLNVDLEPAP